MAEFTDAERRGGLEVVRGGPRGPGWGGPMGWVMAGPKFTSPGAGQLLADSGLGVVSSASNRIIAATNRPAIIESNFSRCTFLQIPEEEIVVVQAYLYLKRSLFNSSAKLSNYAKIIS